MSSQEFDTLRARHPGNLRLVTELEAVLTRQLRADPEAVIDDEIVVQELEESKSLSEALQEHQRDLTYRLLLELVSLDALKEVFFWICENGYGTTCESDHLNQFPTVTFCHRCGQEHTFSVDKVEVYFLPSGQLRSHLLEQSPF